MAKKAPKQKPVKPTPAPKKASVKKPAGTPKPKAAAATAAPAKPFEIDENAGRLARKHRDTYVRLYDAQKKANRAMQGFGKEVKGDGFSLRQIKLMVELSTPEGEHAWKMMIGNDLIAAKYQGAAIGEQLSLFLEPDRTDSSELAYDEGKRDAMDGKKAAPKYAISVPQYQQYMKGFHDVTQKTVEGGIKKLETDEEPKAGETKLIKAADKAAAAPAAGGDGLQTAASEPARAPVPTIPTSGERMTRKEFIAKEAARKTAEQYFPPGGGKAN